MTGALFIHVCTTKTAYVLMIVTQGKATESEGKVTETSGRGDCN